MSSENATTGMQKLSIELSADPNILFHSSNCIAINRFASSC